MKKYENQNILKGETMKKKNTIPKSKDSHRRQRWQYPYCDMDNVIKFCPQKLKLGLIKLEKKQDIGVDTKRYNCWIV